MLVLDTNIPRQIVADDLAIEPFELFERDGGSVHLADGTIVELLAWFHRDPGAWATWKEHRARFDSFLDRAAPVLMGGREILAEAGLLMEAPRPTLPPKKQKQINTLLWSKVRHAEALKELEAGVQIPGTTNLLLVQASGAPQQVQSEADDWIETVDHYKDVVASWNVQVVDRAVSIEDIERSVAGIGMYVDERSTSRPPASVRMDAMMRVHVLLSLRSILKKNPYNARKNKNDALDQELLRYLALPAAVCTSDTKLISKLRDADAWQRRWVVEPADLAEPECRKRLLNLSWPPPWG